MSKPKPKGPGGRPTKYKPEYCDQLIEHMAKGYSFETFGAAVGVARSSVYEWLKNQEFSDAKKEGLMQCQLFWERMGIGGATGRIKGFNVGCWVFNMKNRFGWRDKVETSGEVTVKPYVIRRPSGEEVELGVSKEGDGPEFNDVGALI